MSQPPVYLLPPRPRRRDWLPAGLTAGATLALMELLVAMPGGVAPPPPLALLVAGFDTALVGAIGLAVGVAAEGRGTRLTHSGMVGAMLGPLIGAGLPGALWSEIGAGAPSALGLSGLAAVALFALAAGLAGSRLCEALENSGVAVSAPLVWGATALSMASGERILAANPGGLALALLVAAPGVALLVVVAAHERARRRGGGWVLHPTRALGAVGAAAATVALLPWLRPWIFYDDAMPGLSGSPPSFLMVVLDDRDPVAARAAIDWVGWNGVVHRRVDAGAGGADVGADVDALLASPDLTGLLGELSGRGFATHAIAASATHAARWRVDDVDAKPGPIGLLKGPLRWMASASLLVGPASPLLAALGFGGAQRTPAELTSAAGSWLLAWRSERAPSPFFLAVDFRGSDSGFAAAADHDVDDLVDHLEDVGASPRTALIGWLQTADGVRGAIRPPAGLAAFDRSEDERMSIRLDAWAETVREIAAATTVERPVDLPAELSADRSADAPEEPR